MRALRRPPRPAALDRRKNGKTEFERARHHFIDKGLADGFEFDIYSDPEVKEALRGMTGGNCAYCESYYDSTAPQDVEHFRPKGRIDTAGGKLKPGYWWLASDWDNLLPSCIHCNRETNQILFDQSVLKTGKGDRFPLLDEAQRGKTPGDHLLEGALLIDPCREDPLEFLAFHIRDNRCIMVPRDDIDPVGARRARTSIDIYGLNRQSLVHDRSRYMLRIQLSLRNLEAAVAVLDGLAPQLAASLDTIIANELQSLRYHAQDDRFIGMAHWLITPVMTRLGIRL